MGGPVGVWFAGVALWGVLLTSIAWWRYRLRCEVERTKSGSVSEVTKTIGKILPVLGLLVTLVGCAIEWEAVADGSGRLWVGLLWSAAASIMIFLAGKARRTVIVISLRIVLILLVIGLINQRKLPVFIAIGITAGTLLCVETFWKDGSKVQGATDHP